MDEAAAGLMLLRLLGTTAVVVGPPLAALAAWDCIERGRPRSARNWARAGLGAAFAAYAGLCFAIVLRTPSSPIEGRKFLREALAGSGLGTLGFAVLQILVCLGSYAALRRAERDLRPGE